MRKLVPAIALTLLAGPALADDSVFVDGAWNGSWAAKFPPFIDFLIGPATFEQISNALGPARMDALRTPGTAAANCPAANECTQYYEGTYNYNNSGRHVGCTNGENFFVVYRDDDGSDRGTMLITEAIAGNAPMFRGTFTTDGQPTGNIEGFYQGDGIETPLARIEPGGACGGGGPTFTGCQFLLSNVQHYPHHPAFYASVGRRYLGLEPLSVEVIALQNDLPVEVGTPIEVLASTEIFPGSSNMPEAAERTEMTDDSGIASFPINPPAPAPAETIALTASVTIGEVEYECEAEIETRIDHVFVPFLGLVDQAISEIERLETEADRTLLARQDESRDALAAEAQSPRRPVEIPPIRLPLVFEENRGQADPTAKYVAKTLRGELQVGATRIAIPSKGVGPGPAIGLEFVGGNADAIASVAERLPGHSNYIIGADPAHWIRGAEHAAKVRFASVYEGIDVVYYGSRQRLEYDFEVSPEADPAQIRMRFDGAIEPVVTELGDLVADDGDRAVRLHKPVVYQEDGEERTLIAANYKIDERGDVGFEIGAYDRGRPLIIDPILEASTFLGGPGADLIADVGVDQQGNIYVAGSTSSPGLATAQAFKTSIQAGGLAQSDGFIAKLDPSGTRLLFLTYFGGRKDEIPVGIAVDSQGSVLVTGTTTSEDFPTVAAHQGQLASQFSFGGVDTFTLKLDPTGAALTYSTYLGGKALEFGGAISVDTQGNAYVVGGTTSDDFPIVNAFQPVRATSGLSPDAFAAKLSPTGAPIYVTYLGGPDSDWGFAVAADSSGAAWVVGMTDSEDFPVVSAFQTELGGAMDIFAAKLSADGQALQSSGFLGGSGVDRPRDAAVDSAGNLYITGPTRSADFPLAGAAQMEFGGGEFSQDAYVSKISSTGARLLYSTFYGGSGTDVSNGIALGADGSAYIAGETTSGDLPLVTASQAFNGGGLDGFVVKLSPSGGQVDYATYLGGSLDDTVVGVALDGAGRMVTSGISYSPDFSVTPGSLQPNPLGGPEGFVAKLAPGAPPPAMLSLSGASFLRIHGLAPDSFATAFGSNLTSALVIDSSLPTEIDGVTLTIVDANGASHSARLYIVSPTQINYLIPPAVAPGIATATVRKDGQVRAVETIRIATTAPGVFSAASSGAGVAAAVYLLVDPSGGRTSDLVFDGALAPVPLPLGPEGSELYVFLFGTGMRNAGGQVSVTVDGVAVPFAGPVAQGEFDGLDQINLGPFPRELAGRGELDVVVTVDGKQANAVTLTLQ